MSLPAVRYANLALRFLLELSALGALGYWGLWAGDGLLAKAALGLGAPLLAAVAWGLFVAPRARVSLPLAGRLTVELAVFGSATMALFATGHLSLAVALAGLAAVNRALIRPWAQDERARAREPTHAARTPQRSPATIPAAYNPPVSEFVFNAFVTLLVVVDPLGLAPLFVGLTRGRSVEYRRDAAIRGTMLGAAILFLFGFVGQALLGALGIGFPAFRIAGGALLFLLSLDMIFGRPSSVRRTAEEGEEIPENSHDDVSVFPLAVPLIAGPGSLTTVLLYTGGGGTLEVAAFLGVLLVVLLMTLTSLLLAPRVMRAFGETGTNVLARVLGVLLAALAVQFVLDGIKQSFAL